MINENDEKNFENGGQEEMVNNNDEKDFEKKESLNDQVSNNEPENSNSGGEDDERRVFNDSQSLNEERIDNSFKTHDSVNNSEDMGGSGSRDLYGDREDDFKPKNQNFSDNREDISGFESKDSTDKSENNSIGNQANTYSKEKPDTQGNGQAFNTFNRSNSTNYASNNGQFASNGYRTNGQQSGFNINSGMYNPYSSSFKQDYNHQTPPAGVPNNSGNNQRSNYVTKKSLLMAVTMCILLSVLLGFGAGYSSSFVRSKYAGLSLAPSKESSTSFETPDGSALTVEGVANTVANSVVEITTETVTTGSIMGQYITNGAGSGIIISADGYIATNNHVIKNARKITVTLKNEETYSAKIIGGDSKEDVALLKIDATGLSPVTFADSSTLKVGQKAVAVGNPLGQLGGTVTEGIISALNRDINTDEDTMMNLLQTDAAINPGNSGGGLFDDHGFLIGMVVAKQAGQDLDNLGFAIPANVVKEVTKQLSENGYVRGRVDLQMSVIDISTPSAIMMYRVPEQGVYVYKVESGSNAEAAGFKSGDMIESINSEKVESKSDFTSIINKCSVGDTVKVVVKRNGNSETLNWVLAEEKPN